MSRSEALKRTQAKYLAKCYQLRVMLPKDTEAEIVEFVRSKPNISEYIKSLIRADMKRGDS